MPKEFYTEKDIEDLFNRGTRSLQISENVVLTELAYEMAHRLGLQLFSSTADNPPAAPVRPYISAQQAPRSVPTIGPAAPVAEAPPRPAPAPARVEKESDIEQRIRSAVIARLGNQVDAQLLDNIIHRVVKSIGLK